MSPARSYWRSIDRPYGDRPLMNRRTATLLGVIERVGLPHIRQLTTRPGVMAVHRITAYYADGRARNSAATLFSQQHGDTLSLEVVYENLFDHQPLRYNVRPERYQAYIAALRRAHFDHLDDQPAVEQETMTIWMIERAAGTFYRKLLLAPHRAEVPYSWIVNAVDAHLPEAVRERTTTTG